MSESDTRFSFLCSYLHRCLLESHSNSAGVALVWACTEGHPGLVRFLLDVAEKGDVLDDNSSPVPPLLNRNPIPLPTDLISFCSREDQTPLIAAVRGGRECILRIWRAEDVDVDYGCAPTPLEEPEKAHREEIVRLLLVRGVDFNHVDRNSKCALHYAAQYGDSEICELLLSCGADAGKCDEGNLTPLHLAVFRGRTETVRVILGFPSVVASINEISEDEDTALLLAVQGNHADLVEMLLDFGADQNIRNAEGLTALEVAQALGYTEIVRILRNGGGSSSGSDSDQDP